MSVTINNFIIQNPTLATISSEPNRKFGRRFTVKIQGMTDDASAITTMNQLYKSAYNTYTENKENKAALGHLKTFVATLSQAETDAIDQYTDADCMYKFRTFFHRFFGGAFFGTHSDRLNKLMVKIDAHIDGPLQSQSAQPQSPVQIALPIGKWNNSNLFTEKVYEPLPMEKTFEGTIISNGEFEYLLTKHKEILDSSGSSTHGKAIDNLRDAFYYGKGRTINGSLSNFVGDTTKNQQIHSKVQEALTLVSREELNEQQESMYKLSIAFIACNTGRINTIEEMHDRLLFKSSMPDFEGRVKLKIFAHKQDAFNRLIIEKSDPNGPSSLQFPHMSSGYLAEVGEDLGLSGTLNASTDPHKYNVSSTEKNNFIAEFKNRFTNGLNQLVEDLAGEINNPDGDFYPSRQQPSFGTWVAAKVINGELKQDFAFHDDAKKYTGIKDPTKDQKDNMKFYISNSEVKHILGMLGYLQ